MSSDAQNTADNNTTNRLVPTDIDSNPIEWEGNPAQIDGIMYEVELWQQRTGHFETLLKDGGVLLPNGKLALDSLSAVSFASGDVTDPITYSLTKPCPPTPGRIKNFDDDAVLTGCSTFVPLTAMPAGK